MAKKKKKLSWKERQQRKQMKLQRSQEALQKQRERRAERKSGGWPKIKIFGLFCLIAIIVVSFGVLQYIQPSTPSEEQPPEEPPSIPPANPLYDAYDFTLTDINGTEFSLSDFNGRVVVVHVMGVGCKGQINVINDYELRQLKTVCQSFCGNEDVTLITVVVSTCDRNDLALIRNTYDVTWLFGNDYDDGRVEIVQNYAEHGDGTIVLIDKTFHVSNSYGEIDSTTLSSAILQLLGA